MIERVIENWLDSTTEREYQFAFCQALLSEGFRIHHVSSHGQMEQGKDIIATDKHGTHYAYQLKSGDIDQSAWRRTIRGEVEELVELPIQHPNIPQAAHSRAVLVTNGTITDPVRREITDRQAGWQRNGHSPLELITKWQLLEMFVKAQGTFLPRSPADFELFLRIFLRDKREPLNKEEFAGFLENSLPLTAEVKRMELRRTFSAIALLASYALSGCQRAGNSFALSEGWMLVIAHLLRLAEKVRSYEPVWLPSIELCVQAWEQSAEALVKESLEKKSWIEGNPFVDGDTIPFYARIFYARISAMDGNDRGAHRVRSAGMEPVLTALASISRARPAMGGITTVARNCPLRTHS